MEYSQTVKDDARKVHEYLKEHGWCQRHFEDGNGRSCLVGAINRSIPAGRNGNMYRAINAGLGMDPMAFNDKTGRTFSEVEEVLQRIYNS